MVSEYIQKRILPRFQNKHYFDVVPQDTLLRVIESGRTKFTIARCVDFAQYNPKATSRYEVAMRHFPETFKGKIADIGDRSGALQRLAAGVVSTLDKNNPALETFDWDVSPLPFSDREFDSVFCLDTLEHITDIHHAFDDLLRISKSTVVISLPNCWKKAFKEFVLGYGVQSSYGLPLEKPIDRHRWFMNTDDIQDFMLYRAKKNAFQVEKMIFWAPKGTWWHELVRICSPIIPDKYFKNLFVQTVFVKLVRDN